MARMPAVQRAIPNLTDNDWLWGNSEAALTATLTNGRNGVMPVLAPALGGEQGINNMVTYVRSLSGLVEPDAAAMSAQADVRRSVQCLPHGRRHGQPDLRRSQPDRRHLAVWLLGGGDLTARSSTVATT